MAGLSYRESAGIYHCALRLYAELAWEIVIDEWTAPGADSEYAENVRLKPGAREYLQCACGSEGVKLAVATALPAEYL